MDQPTPPISKLEEVFRGIHSINTYATFSAARPIGWIETDTPLLHTHATGEQAVVDLLVLVLLQIVDDEYADVLHTCKGVGRHVEAVVEGYVVVEEVDRRVRVELCAPRHVVLCAFSVSLHGLPLHDSPRTGHVLEGKTP